MFALLLAFHAEVKRTRTRTQTRLFQSLPGLVSQIPKQLESKTEKNLNKHLLQRAEQHLSNGCHDNRSERLFRGSWRMTSYFALSASLSEKRTNKQTTASIRHSERKHTSTPSAGRAETSLAPGRPRQLCDASVCYNSCFVGFLKAPHSGRQLRWTWFSLESPASLP